ncbi:MAG: lysophospholipid acyltransferase family protein [Gemmatimonadetes bacterium]|nr:lysophospholipid acyltransferase family protein [Gemmatimonadota bacterium]
MKLRWAEPVASVIGMGLVRLLASTWRVRVRGEEHLRALRTARRPFVFVLWHSRILPLLHHHRNEKVVLLISRHRDGGYLTALAQRWGYRFVRGSSKRGGEVGLLGIVRALEDGAEVAVTPDGPRGPAEQVKPGAVAAAQHAHVPLLPIGARASAAWWIDSWDRFCIPKPFARIEVVYGPVLEVGHGKDELRRGITAVEGALRVVTHGP